MHVLTAAGGKMTVPCEGQLLLLLRPMDGGPVPEPIVLGHVPPLDVLMEAEGVQVCCTPMSPGNMLAKETYGSQSFVLPRACT